MARTTAKAVQDILLDNYDAENKPSLTRFIEAANVLVTRVAACAAAKSKTLTAAELELIECWLAAHFYAYGPDLTYASKSTANKSATFHGKTEMNLDGTPYGQTAKGLDFSGCLAAFDKRQVASGFWAGKVPSEQIDYADRD